MGTLLEAQQAYLQQNEILITNTNHELLTSMNFQFHSNESQGPWHDEKYSKTKSEKKEREGRRNSD